MQGQPLWLARIRNSRGGTAGTGVAVDGEHVITCAHLAESRPNGGATLLLEPGREVTVEFPFLGCTAIAKVVDDGWFPELPDGTGDFAVLRLLDPPIGLTGAPLRRIPGPRGTEVEMRGFPDDQAVARTAKGRLSNPPRREWVQIDPEGDGWAIEKGFSGGPVWDVDQKAVVGLTVAKDAHRVGHMLSMAYLCELWPPLNDRLSAVPPAREEDLSHWWPRARGLSGAHEQGWLFRGREKALTEIVEWLREGRRHSVLVVTGTPGVGKSATLGRIVTTSHRPWAAMLPEEDTAVRAELGSVDCAVHAKGKTALEVANEILTRRATGPIERLEDFAGVIDAVFGDDGQFNVVLDALDEAADASEARLIAARVLRPISSLPMTKVVVGSRRVDGAGDLLTHFGDGLHKLDLDSPEYFEFQDLSGYAQASLQLASSEQRLDPYGDPGIAAAIAERIAELAEGNFLVAGLVARSRGRYDQAPVAPAELRFSSDVNVVFWEYLERLEPFDGIPARELLIALAFADAPGFTIELWCAAMQALNGITVNPKRLIKFATTGAANFLIESGASHGRSFRIFHQALVDACLQRRTETEDRAESESSLTDAFVQIGTAKGWEQAPQYLWRSLPGHAARGGAVETLLAELEFLVVAEPERLLPVLSQASTEESALRATIYRTSSGHLYNAAFHERRAMLSYNAARYGARELTASLAKPLEWQPLWATGDGMDSRMLLSVPLGPTGTETLVCTVLDGVPIAASGHLDSVRIWNLATGSLQPEIHTSNRSWVTALAIGSLEGRTVLVIGCQGGMIEVVDPITGRVLSTSVSDYPESITCIECTVVDGRPVAVSMYGPGMVILVDLLTGARREIGFAGQIGQKHSLACADVAGRSLAVTCVEDGPISIWDLAIGRRIGELVSEGPSTPYLTGSYTLDTTVLNGRPIVVTGRVGSLRMWDLESQEPLSTVFGDASQTIVTIACTELQGEPVVVVGGGEGRIQVWRLTDQREYGQAFTMPADALSRLVCTTVEGREIAVSCGVRGLIRVWDLSAPERHEDNAIGHEHKVAAVASTSRSGRPAVLSTSVHDGIVLRDPLSGNVIRTIADEDPNVMVERMSCLSMDGDRLVATVSRSDLIRMWQVDSGEQMRPVLTGIEWPQAIVCTTIDGRSVAVVGGHDGLLRLRNLESGDLIREIDTGERNGIVAIDSFTIDDDPHAVAMLQTGSLRSWNLRTGDPRHYVEIPPDAWAPEGLGCTVIDGRVIAATGGNNRVDFYDLTTGAKVSTIPFPEPVQAIAFTESGDLIIGSGRDVALFTRAPR